MQKGFVCKPKTKKPKTKKWILRMITLPVTHMIKLKIIVAGAKDVGKTSLIRRFVHGLFQTDTVGTIGVDFMTKRLTLNNQEIRLSLWDFAGEKKFRNMFPSYMAGASAAIILFDITNRGSFDDLIDWMELITSSTGKMLKILIGSKHDLADQAVISDTELTHFRELYAIDHFMYCSAKTGENVDSLFTTVTQKIIDHTLKSCPFCQERIAQDIYFCTFYGKPLEI